jgi:curved DNA-binding protein CbpA
MRPTPVMRIQDAPRQAPPSNSMALARIPPPKRALDALHEAYAVLGIDDNKPLSHEALKLAYKRASLRAHPDKGGSPEAFDNVTRSFLYLKEVLDVLIPRNASADTSDERFTAPVTMDAALRARGMNPTAAAPSNALKIEDAPPIALNPKKLDMTVFNKLFEENKLPDPDRDDGYGDWLKGQETAGGIPADVMRGNFNKDMFNRTFEEESRKIARESGTLAKYKPPEELRITPTFGTEIGTGRPAQFTKAPTAGGGIAYTDLRHAYGEGSTFSQEVNGVSLEGRPKTLEEAKRAYGSAPTKLSAEEAAAVAHFERAREEAERQRQMRAAAQDVNINSAHDRLKRRLLIQ